VTPASSRGATLLTAAWVAPMDGPLIRDGAVLIAGERITAVGPAADLRKRPAESVRDYGEAVILPGLVNAHTHLELSRLTRPDRPGPFIDWLTAVLGAGLDADTAAAAATDGAVESLRFGVTTVGDISRHAQAVRAALRRSPLRGISYGEVVGMARRKHVMPGLLSAAADDAVQTAELKPGVSPHAPYSIDADGYRRCLEAARANGLPLTTHLAESPDEAAFLRDHAGPFRELWERLGAWDDTSVNRFDGSPVRYAAALGLLDHRPTALAHVNYCDDAGLALLARRRASVVYCPRTHAYFGHPPHRWREMLGAGVNVAVGTDSRASSPDLNLVDDLRLLRRVAPDVPARTLWEMATTRGACALGFEDTSGSIAPGRFADLAVFLTKGVDPLDHILESTVVPREVWARGTTVVRA
jgi:cytosine/adenosine deaminase-related metal-dependent hydrolase